MAGVWWIFRPVLGKELVRPGPRLVFVQVSLPSGDDPNESFGHITIDSYWRKLDKRTGGIGRLIPGSYYIYTGLDRIPVISLRQDTTSFDRDSIEDLHNGQLAINLRGTFLHGTYIRIGNQMLTDAKSGLVLEDQRLIFSATTLNLANNAAQLVSRDGTEKALSLGVCARAPSFKPVTSNVDETHIKVEASIKVWPAIYPKDGSTGPLSAPDYFPVVLVVGGKAYGPGEPLKKDVDSLSVIVPTADLISFPQIGLVSLFTEDDNTYSDSDKVRVSCSVREELSDFQLPNQADKFIYLGSKPVPILQSASKRPAVSGKSTKPMKSGASTPPKQIASYALFGNHLAGATILYPDGLRLQPFISSDGNTIQRLDVPLESVEGGGMQVLLRKEDQEPISIPLPSPPKNSTAATSFGIYAQVSANR